MIFRGKQSAQCWCLSGAVTVRQDSKTMDASFFWGATLNKASVFGCLQITIRFSIFHICSGSTGLQYHRKSGLRRSTIPDGLLDSNTYFWGSLKKWLSLQVKLSYTLRTTHFNKKRTLVSEDLLRWVHSCWEEQLAGLADASHSAVWLGHQEWCKNGNVQSLISVIAMLGIECQNMAILFCYGCCSFMANCFLLISLNYHVENLLYRDLLLYTTVCLLYILFFLSN